MVVVVSTVMVVVIMVPVVATATVVITALFTPVVVLRGRGLPCHDGGLVIRDRLHHAVLRPRLVIGYWWGYVVLWLRLVVSRGLLVMRRHWVRTGCITRVVVLAGDAGTHQSAGTCSENRTIAPTDRIANGRTGHRANTGAYNGVEVIRTGLRGKNHQATSHQSEASPFCYFCSRWGDKRS